MLRRKRHYVIYPEYFDAHRSRSLGRKVSLDKAAEEPSLKKVVYACNKLGYEYEIQADKAFPSNWWNKMGRVLIKIDKKNKIPKQQIVNDIADIVKRLKKKKKKVVKKKGSKVTQKVRNKPARGSKK